MFRSTPDSDRPSPEFQSSEKETLKSAELIPLSVLELDLDAPSIGGWAADLNSRGIAVVEDDIGRPAVTRADARMLIAERRENEARKARKFEEAERQAIELDQQRRAQIWAGLPASLIHVGVSAAEAMAAADRAGRPRRRSVLEDSLSNSGTVFHPIQHGADES